MGFWSSLGSVCSSVCSAVSSVASSIGSGLASAAKGLLSVAGSYFSPMVNIISSVAQMLGVCNKEDSPEDLGRRAVESNKKPEDFDSTEQYIEHLKNDIQIDQEKMKTETDIDKMAYTAIGAGIEVKGISEKKGFEIPLETWATFAKLGMEDKEQEVNALLDDFKSDVGKLTDYAEGKLNAKEEMTVGNQLVETYQRLEPDMPEADIEKKVMQFETGGNL